MMRKNCVVRILFPSIFALTFVTLAMAQTPSLIGKEISVPEHLQDGQEFKLSLRDLIAFGQELFQARWTLQEGQGRPLSKGTGNPLSDPTSPLVFPRNPDEYEHVWEGSCISLLQSAIYANELRAVEREDRITSVAL